MGSEGTDASGGHPLPAVFPGYPPADQVGLPSPPPRSRRRALVLVAAIVVVLALGATVIVALVSTGARGPAPTPRSAIPAFEVVSLAATAVSPVEVRLDWSATGADIEEYVVYRDGAALLTVRAPITTYTDRTVKPDRAYEYGIEAVAPGGVTERVVVSLTTPAPPPLAEARLEGSWTVRTTYVGGNAPHAELGDQNREEWVFRPSCDEGACKVRVDLYYKGQGKTILTRRGRTYRGDGMARYHRCDKVAIPTTLEISLKVTRGRYFLGVWRASAFTGSLTTTSPAALGCISGEVRRTLRGTFRP
jgi:hypothetical protein